MNILNGKIVNINELSKSDIRIMYELMVNYYDNMKYEAFINDLYAKDYCILLLNKNNDIEGFSTQKIMEFKIDNKIIHGVFSGDTIIDKDYWGNFDLHKVFAKFFFDYGEQFDHFYWFLISKGYKTYKMLPAFFKKSYPNYREETPNEIKKIMNAFGKYAYEDEYDEKDGVIKYKKSKDKLKDGVADIDEKRLKDKDIRFFVKINPTYIKGNDLVCITELKKDNLRPTAKRLFYGE